MTRQLLYHKRSRSDFAGFVSPSISLLLNLHPYERAVGFDLHSLLWMDLIYFPCNSGVELQEISWTTFGGVPISFQIEETLR